jgi:hypothetical protein
VARERGGLPLVLVTDNGPVYVCATVEDWLAEHGVTHLLSLPHTPRHNPWVERANGELKAETGLGRGVILNDDAEVRARVEAARCRLDAVRLRASLGFRTAAAADAGLTGWYDVSTREHFLATGRVSNGLVIGGRRGVRRSTRRWRNWDSSNGPEVAGDTPARSGISFPHTTRSPEHTRQRSQVHSVLREVLLGWVCLAEVGSW